MLTAAGPTIQCVLLTVLTIWTGLAVPTALFVAALGRGGSREDQALGHLQTPRVTDHDVRSSVRQLVHGRQGTPPGT